MEDNYNEQGIVTRVVSNDLAYAYDVSNKQTFTFSPDLATYPGGLERFDELEGARISVFRGTVNNDLIDVRFEPVIINRNQNTDENLIQASERLPSLTRHVMDLHPDDCTAKQLKVDRALPMLTRKFGKLVDTRGLLPGDLILTREINPDYISDLITEVQLKGGYSEEMARWTHVAMYVGDGVHVVEATFNDLYTGGDVRLTSLDEYCQGNHAMRFRRPNKGVETDQKRWSICVRALSRLKQPYNFMQAVQMWYNVVVKGRGFYSLDGMQQRAATTAVVCSTLYADSFNEATRRSLGELNGTCVPAWLSDCDDFDDIQVEWLKIA